MLPIIPPFTRNLKNPLNLVPFRCIYLSFSFVACAVFFFCEAMMGQERVFYMSERLLKHAGHIPKKERVCRADGTRRF